MDTRQKILSRAGLHEVLDEHRRSGRKVVFVFGVFDLLHAGHVRHLAAARAEGDLLVVAVHSDAAAKRLKGEGRPLRTERARAVLVAALAAVDYVVVFGEAEVMPLLRELQPDVLAAGSDATPDDSAPGELTAHGIRVASMGGDSWHSTTALIARVRRGCHGN
jgi:D-beta-D-heptose 7-phosphate kinase / D-beta-D-heptose 1-phosphate adenosyltransferase